MAAAAADIEPEAEGLRFVESRVAYANDEWRARAAAAGGGANVTDDDKPKIGSKQSRHANTSLVDVRIWDARPVADRLRFVLYKTPTAHGHAPVLSVLRLCYRHPFEPMVLVL